MSTNRSKEIELLRSRLEALEEEERKEQEKRRILEQIYSRLTEELNTNGLSLDQFVQTFREDFQQRLNKTGIVKRGPTVAKKAASTSRRSSRTQKKKAAPASLKIPAGKYSNVPPDPGRVIEVKEKGPRPKLLKAYAAKIGIEKFMQECRLK